MLCLIRWLIDYIKLNQKDGKLAITNVNENVMEVFEMTGLAGLLNIR